MRVNKTILLIYRNEEKLQDLSAELIRKGYFIISEKTCAAALKILRRINIDLIISSGSFQDMSRESFLGEIKSLRYINKTIYIPPEENIEEFFKFGSLGLLQHTAASVPSCSLITFVEEFFQDSGAILCSQQNQSSIDSSLKQFIGKIGKNWKKLSLLDVTNS